MKQCASYILSAYSFIFTDPLDKLLNVGYQLRDGNPIPSFDENLLINLCSEAEQIFREEKNILEIEGDLIVVGDIHGSLHDLLRILHFINENKTKVLFLGDYVDRGCFSLECITILFALKILHPDLFYLIRGNHEFESLCRQYGFKNEIITYYEPKKHPDSTNTDEIPTMKKSKSLIIDVNSQDDTLFDDYYAIHTDHYRYKYTEKLYDSFIKTFSYLPIAAIVNNSTFCIHGGLSPKIHHIDNLNKNIIRPVFTFEDNDTLSDVVWSDPSHSLDIQFEENPRGRGYLFNRETVATFLRNNSLVRIIRAHQCVLDGSHFEFNDKLITVFSASSYDTALNNSSAVLQLFQKDDTVKVTCFPPLERLMKIDAFYYKVQAWSLTENNLHTCFSLLHPSLRENVSLFKSTGKFFIATRKSGNSKSTPLIKPKFTTNPRKSCYVVVKKPIIVQENPVDYLV